MEDSVTLTPALLDEWQRKYEQMMEELKRQKRETEFLGRKLEAAHYLLSMGEDLGHRGASG
jgi:hypothetical protein